MSWPIVQTGIQNALSCGATAVSLTLPGSANTRIKPTHCIINVVGVSIRWRADGTAPTATAGILVPAGSNIEFMDGTINYQSLIERFQAIATSGTATLEVAFFAGD